MSELRVVLARGDSGKLEVLGSALEQSRRLAAAGWAFAGPLAAAVRGEGVACVRASVDACPGAALGIDEEVLEEGDVALAWAGREVLVLRPSAGVMEGWLLGERIRQRAGAADGGVSVGVAAVTAATHRGVVDQLAERAMRLARHRGGDRVCTWDMVRLERASRAEGERPAVSPAARRSRFIKRCAPHLGPTQREHLTTHSEQVAELAARLAWLVGAGQRTIERARLSGLMHDIGKSAIPEALLAKPSALSSDERAVMDRHAEEGAALASRLGVDPDLSRSILHHHTRFDAVGRPTRFLDDALPIEARLVNVADAVVAMTTDRPYRAARSRPEAMAELRRQRGKQFDPVVVDAALTLLGIGQRLAA